MQRINVQHDYYDVLIQASISQVLDQQKKFFEDKIWQEMQFVYEEGKNRFLNHINEFKNELHALLDEYLLEKKLANKTLNANSSELLGQIFMCIQSIENIDTGRMAYLKMKYLFNRGDEGSPTLYKYANQIINTLSYYFDPCDGKCIEPSKDFHFYREKENIVKHISVFEERIYSLVNNYLHKKYEEVLENDMQLKEVLVILDLILTSIAQFCTAKTERIVCPHVEYLTDDDRTWKEFEEDVNNHYYNKAKWDDDDNTWNPRSEERIIELATILKKSDEENYAIAQGKEINSKNETLRLINSFLTPSYLITSEIFSKTGDPDIDLAFHTLLTKLKENIAGKYFCLLEIEPQNICKRLAILLEEKTYLDFIQQLCAEINTQCVPEELKTVTANRRTSEPLLKMRQSNFTLFGTVKDLPKLALPKSLSDGDAIHFLYGNKGL